MAILDVINPDLSIEFCATRLKLMAPDRRFEVKRSVEEEASLMPSLSTICKRVVTCTISVHIPSPTADYGAFGHFLELARATDLEQCLTLVQQWLEEQH
jgi:hypothetical protein